MTTREKYREINLKINQQLKSAGVLNSAGTKVVKPLDTLPDSEWKTWIKQLMIIRDTLGESC